MFKKFGIVLAVLVVGFLGYVATRPSAFVIERSTTMKASRAQVAAHVVDFHAWEAWSPWAKLDPAMKTTYSGPASGVGAVYEWTGDDKVGSGRMTITDVKADELVGVKLEFLAPWTATNRCEFSFTTEGDETKVSWRMGGERNFGMKAAGVVMNMDQMVGGDFERGLTAMKYVVEAEAAKAAEAARAAAPVEQDAGVAEGVDAGAP